MLNDCTVLGGTTMVQSEIKEMSSIDRFGPSIAFYDVILTNADNLMVSVVVQLRGNTPEAFPFLPVGDPTTDNPTKIDHFMIQGSVSGHTLKGIRPKGHCNKDGHSQDLDGSTLTITACPAGTDFPNCTPSP